MALLSINQGTERLSTGRTRTGDQQVKATCLSAVQPAPTPGQTLSRADPSPPQGGAPTAVEEPMGLPGPRVCHLKSSANLLSVTRL